MDQNTSAARQLYPITSGQMMIYYTQKFCFKKQISNICATISIGQADEALLYQSVLLAAMRFPSMNCRITTQGEKLMQYFVDDIPQNIRIVDLSTASEEEIEKTIDKWSAVPFPNKGMDVPLYRINILKMPGGTYTLYFCVCHMIMDAYALMGCMDYIGQIYVSLRDGTPFPLLKKTPLECYMKSFSYFTSEKYQKDQQWWKELFQKEPVFTSMNGKTGRDYVKGKKYGVVLRSWKVNAEHLNLRIPKEIVDMVNTLADRYSVSPHTVYLVAMRAYLSAVNDTEDVTFMDSVARRSTVLQKHAGGTMVNAIPLRTTFSNDLSLSDTLTEMFRTQRETYRHADVPCGQILQMIKQIHNPPVGMVNHNYTSVSLTYQPYFIYSEGPFHCTFQRRKNGAAATPLYLSIMPLDDTGDFWVNYEYLTDLVLPESLEKSHAFMLNFIRFGFKSPDSTVSDLIKKSL